MSQCDAIQKDLERGLSLTQLDAYNLYGCTRLAARISDLKDKGVPVMKHTIKRNGKHYACYYVERHGTG